VRRQGGVRSTAVLPAVGINEKGQREILGLHTALGETEGAWKFFLKHFSKRGLSGVEPIFSTRTEMYMEWSTSHRYLKMEQFYEWCENQTAEAPKNRNQNHRIALLNRPNRQDASHNFLDLTLAKQCLNLSQQHLVADSSVDVSNQPD